MIILLDGIEAAVPDGLTVAGLLEWAKEGDPHVMVEVNRRYIQPKDYDTTRINDHDAVELINPNLGG